MSEAVTRIQVGGTAGSEPYEVLVGRQLLGELGGLVGEKAQRVAVIHPEALADTGDALRADLAGQGFEAVAIQVPNAEEAKTAEVAAYCWKALGQSGFTRTDVVVGVGGGATTDLAGYVAATWLRGVRWIAIPTTVLAMVDAAVGGKTGINTAEGKNLVGAFHPPAGVLCDLAALDSLPVNDYVSGLAEIIKAGFIADPVILELIESDPEAARTPAARTPPNSSSARSGSRPRSSPPTSRSRASGRSSTTATRWPMPSRRTSGTSGGTAPPSPWVCTSPPNWAAWRAGWTTRRPTATAPSSNRWACRCTTATTSGPSCSRP